MHFNQTSNLQWVNCPLCNSKHYQALFTAKDLLFGMPGEFQVVECMDCKLKYTNPRPATKNLSDFYGTQYPAYQLVTSHPRKKKYKEIYPKTKHTFQGGYFGSRAWVFPPLLPSARVFEMGCGIGKFVQECHNRGWEVVGTDLNPQMEEYVTRAGGSFKKTTLPHIDFPNNYFDAIFAWQVIEHLPQPLETLQEVKRVLKPGGTFAFSVPNSSCWQFHLFKDKWAGLQVPTHLTHFSEATLVKLVEQSGLYLEAVYAQNTIGCLLPSIGLLFGEKNSPLKPSANIKLFTLVFKAFDRFSGILISSLLGKRQAERLTIVCKKLLD